MSQTTEVVITNSQGLHARPAAVLVETMKGFDASLSISVGAKTANCNSIMSVLALGAGTGATAVLEADGPDAERATEAAVAILTSDED
ncbi:MAG: HPr family phosphocarrier protein [Actinomycetota bacterium]